MITTGCINVNSDFQIARSGIKWSIKCCTLCWQWMLEMQVEMLLAKLYVDNGWAFESKFQFRDIEADVTQRNFWMLDSENLQEGSDRVTFLALSIDSLCKRRLEAKRFSWNFFVNIIVKRSSKVNFSTLDCFAFARLGGKCTFVNRVWVPVKMLPTDDLNFCLYKL